MKLYEYLLQLDAIEEMDCSDESDNDYCDVDNAFDSEDSSIENDLFSLFPNFITFTAQNLYPFLFSFEHNTQQFNSEYNLGNEYLSGWSQSVGAKTKGRKSPAL